MICMSLKHPLPHAAKHSRDLRRNSTKAEQILWKALRNRAFHGFKFRRQAPIGRFIVDFLCVSPALIIELDGDIHAFQMKQDEERTEAIMQDWNIPILRLRNIEIFDDLAGALRKIESHLIP